MGLTSAGLVLTACTTPVGAPAQQAGGEQAASPAGDKILLRIQTNPDFEKAVGDLFIQAHPEVELEYVSVTGIDHEEVASKILSMVAAGQALNLGFACTEATQLYAGQGLSENLDEYVKRDAEELKEYFTDVSPTLIEAMLFEGSIYQLAQNFNAANMYFNTAVLADAGVEQPPADWTKDDFYEIAKATTKKSASGETEVFGYAWTNRLWGSWMPWIFVNNGNILTEERAPGGEWFWETFYADDPAAEGRGGGWRWLAPKANDPANVEALEFMVQLTQEGLAPAAELGGGATLQGFFTNGKLAMTPAGGFWAGGLHNAGMTPDSFNAQLWPQWKSQRHQFGVCAKFLFTQSDNKDLGWEYLKHEVSKEAMSVHGYFADGIYVTTPSRRSMCTAEAFSQTGPANWDVFYGTLDQHPDTAPIPAPPVSNPMTTIFTTYTARAMTFELTPQEALDGMQSELEELFARNPDQYPASS
jgi:ABC-type glycerol-3-phosphate transport system substrate-binding protein